MPSAVARFAMLSSALLCAACIEGYDDGARDDDVVVGALLPFAGEQAGAGPNFEGALRLLSETVNDAGGLGGRRLRFEVRDGHADPKRATRAAEELLGEGAVAVIGPVKADIASAVTPMLAAHDVLAITGAWAADTQANSDALVRTAPTSQALASVLADQARDDGVERIAVVHVADAYGESFAAALADDFVADGAGMLRTFSVAQGPTSLEALVTDIQVFDADAIVLVTYLQQAADLVLALPRARLYLTSTLKNERLLRNVPAGVLEGAIGVSPAVSTDFKVFAGTYRERWGEEPLEEAAFFYDAAALVSLAIQRTLANGGALTASSLRPTLIALSRAPRGTAAAWFQMDTALGTVANKRDVNYRGVSGAVDLTDQGQVGRGLVQLWQFENGKIVPRATVAAHL